MQITSPNGRWIQFTYDLDVNGNSHVTQAQDNIGRTVQYSYDAAGHLTQVTDANNGVWKYSYNTADQMTSITDPRNLLYLQNQYDVSGRVAKQIQADNTFYQYTYTEDEFGNVQSTDVTDPRGNTDHYDFFTPPSFVSGGLGTPGMIFSQGGNTADEIHGLGTPEQQTITYLRQDGSNFLLSVTDPLNRRTSYNYDVQGNMTSVTALSGTSSAVTTSFSYEPKFRHITSVTDPLNHTTSFAYDNNGNPTTITDALNHQTTFTYNSEGQPLTVTDSLGNTESLAYDNGDLTSISDPRSRTTTRFLDPVGRLKALTDPEGNLTHYDYDALNEVTGVTDPLGNSTSFAYDPNGNLLRVTDANSHVTRYVYDSMDRLMTRTDPLNNSESYSYDANGNLLTFTDRRGKITSYNYDALNRRTFAGFGTQAGPTYESTISYSYDAGNRPTSVVDSGTGTITPTFDNLNRLTSEQTSQGTVSYGYDAAGRRTSMTAGGQSAVNYTYDNANRLTQITQGSSAVSLAYDTANRRTSLTLPNGVVMSYSYDIASQLSGITYTLGSNTLGNLTYSYDLAGRRIGMGGSYARTGLPLAISTTAYNADNRLTTWGTANLFYDANGNMISDGVNSFNWNARNQLSSMNSNFVSFQYDPYGRRSGKTVAGITTNFLYDGANIAQEISGGSPITNLLSGGVDEVFTRTDASGTANFLTDALGSTLNLTDSSGNSLAQYAYEPFGNTTLVSGNSSNSYEYTGRENDDTGLYYYRARYYNPAIGRFISEDPVGLAGGINRYAYTKNDPVNRVDPSGKYDWWWHAYITYHAFIDLGYDSDRAWAMAQMVGNVDFDGNQGTTPDAAHTHAMAGRKPNSQQNETCQQAYSGTMQQIRNDITDGNIPQALHTIEDATAPAHRGYQPYNGLLHLSLFHLSSDANPGWGPINEAIQNTEQFMKDYWNDPNNVNPANSLPQNPCR
jgi:RHS repeat-associated protein